MKKICYKPINDLSYQMRCRMFPFSDEELQKPVLLAIEKIRPMLSNDGGNISILAIKDAKVYVRLEGACNGCSSSANTLKYGIEKQLKEDIHPGIEVINIPHGQEKEFLREIRTEEEQ